MIITKTIDGNEAVLKVEGRLDTLNSPELSEEIDGLGEDISSIVMDFSELEYISSSGLRVVIIAQKKVNGALVIKNASARIRSIFMTTGLDDLVKFEKD